MSLFVSFGVFRGVIVDNHFHLRILDFNLTAENTEIAQEIHSFFYYIFLRVILLFKNFIF